MKLHLPITLIVCAELDVSKNTAPLPALISHVPHNCRNAATQFLDGNKQAKDTLGGLSLPDSVEGASCPIKLFAGSELVLPASEPISGTVVTHDGKTTSTG